MVVSLYTFIFKLIDGTHRKSHRRKNTRESACYEKQKENTKKLFIESYGCQMNMNDSEIVAAILDKEGYNTTQILRRSRFSTCKYMLNQRESRNHRS